MQAITTIRLNSSRISKKSVAPLNGIPLLNYALGTMTEVVGLDKIIVYSHDDLTEYIKPELVEYLTIIKRPAWMDGDNVTFCDIMSEAINHVVGDYVLFFTVTAPFIQPSTVSHMVRDVMHGEHDSAFLATELKSFCWYKGEPLNYELDDVKRTQQLNPLIVETSSLYIFSKRLFKETGRRIGYNPYINVVDAIEGFDIDYPADLKIANAVANNRKPYLQ